MKVAVVFLAALAVSSAVVKPSEKEKRGAIAYSTPKNYQIEGSQEAYSTAKVSPQTFPQGQQYQTVKYTTQQQAAPVAYQQQYDYEQAYQGQQQTVTKLAPAKVAFASAPGPSPAQTHYSLASDVSSFSYNSPIVKYSNLGVLSQNLGKLAQTEQQVQYTSASSPQSSPQIQYTTQKEAAYSFPQQQQQKVSYTPQPQPQYHFRLSAPQHQQPQQKLAYTTVPQKVSYAPAPQQIEEYTKSAPQIQYTKPQQQQVTYITAGQKQEQQQAYQYIPQSQLQAYVSSAQQQPQEQQQQQQYVYSQVPQGYEKAYSQQYTAAQSNPQPAYLAPQRQYYSAKAPLTGVRYA